MKQSFNLKKIATEVAREQVLQMKKEYEAVKSIETPTQEKPQSKVTPIQSIQKGPFVSVSRYPELKKVYGPINSNLKFEKVKTKEEAQDLAKGIGVKYLDPKLTLDVMNMILETYVDALKRGHPITDSVKTVVPRKKVTIGGLSEKYSTFTVNLQQEYWKDTEGYSKLYSQENRWRYDGQIGRWWATSNPNAVPYHELGHNYHKIYYPDSFYKETCKVIFTESDYEFISANLSLYAMDNYKEDKDRGNFALTASEFVAEVYARLAAKEPVSLEIINIYTQVLKNEYRGMR